MLILFDAAALPKCSALALLCTSSIFRLRVLKLTFDFSPFVFVFAYVDHSNPLGSVRLAIVSLGIGARRLINETVRCRCNITE